MSSSTPSPQESFVHGKLINLVRTGQAVTRPALEQETGLGRKVVTQRVQQAIDVGLLEDGDLAPSAGGPALPAAALPDRGRPRLRRPHRRHRDDRRRGHARRHAARVTPRGLGRGGPPRGDPRGARRPLRPAGPQDPHRAVGVRHRDRRSGGLQHRAAGRAADHARLGRLQRPVLAPRALRRAGVGRQRREPHGPGRVAQGHAAGRPRPALRARRRRASGAGLVSRGTRLPGRHRRGRGHRPHPGDRRPRRRLPVRPDGLPGRRDRRVGPGPQARPPGPARARLLSARLASRVT